MILKKVVQNTMMPPITPQSHQKQSRLSVSSWPYTYGTFQFIPHIAVITVSGRNITLISENWRISLSSFSAFSVIFVSIDIWNEFLAIVSLRSMTKVVLLRFVMRLFRCRIKYLNWLLTLSRSTILSKYFSLLPFALTAPMYRFSKTSMSCKNSFFSLTPRFLLRSCNSVILVSSLRLIKFSIRLRPSLEIQNIR